ncbi:hypothetical protein T4B_14048 [Trichinella pseudospiralis]|uniref:Uncharacterized protein n=1 Tax=Trichinella pseudospiralis TaxID=6337 RepID=A0A0V1H8T6_TRIPS|nr:hypothetical protein T4B_14048 [Trichinella pseudospiralis]
MPREAQERTDFSHAFSRHCHDLCRLRVHANPLLRCNMAEILHALAHKHLETDLAEMLLVTPSWPGALSWEQSRLRPSKVSQWKHTAAVLVGHADVRSSCSTFLS